MLVHSYPKNSSPTTITYSSLQPLSRSHSRHACTHDDVPRPARCPFFRCRVHSLATLYNRRVETLSPERGRWSVEHISMVQPLSARMLSSVRRYSDLVWRHDVSSLKCTRSRTSGCSAAQSVRGRLPSGQASSSFKCSFKCRLGRHAKPHGVSSRSRSSLSPQRCRGCTRTGTRPPSSGTCTTPATNRQPVW